MIRFSSAELPKHTQLGFLYFRLHSAIFQFLEGRRTHCCSFIDSHIPSTISHVAGDPGLSFLWQVGQLQV